MKLLNVTNLLTEYENIRKSQFPTSKIPNVRGGIRARNYHWSVITLGARSLCSTSHGLSFARQRGEMPGEAPGEARRRPQINKNLIFQRP